VSLLWLHFGEGGCIGAALACYLCSKEMIPFVS
jgi:hypothetical protein